MLDAKSRINVSKNKLPSSQQTTDSISVAAFFNPSQFHLFIHLCRWHEWCTECKVMVNPLNCTFSICIERASYTNICQFCLNYVRIFRFSQSWLNCLQINATTLLQPCSISCWRKVLLCFIACTLFSISDLTQIFLHFFVTDYNA